MLSDLVTSAYSRAYDVEFRESGRTGPHCIEAGVRAVEAAVRADERKVQIKKDAAIADRLQAARLQTSPRARAAIRGVAAVIRAQLTEGENDE